MKTERRKRQKEKKRTIFVRQQRRRHVCVCACWNRLILKGKRNDQSELEQLNDSVLFSLSLSSASFALSTTSNYDWWPRMTNEKRICDLNWRVRDIPLLLSHSVIKTSRFVVILLSITLNQLLVDMSQLCWSRRAKKWDLVSHMWKDVLNWKEEEEEDEEQRKGVRLFTLSVKFEGR